MLSQAPSNLPESKETSQFENLIRDGILAVKQGNLPNAKRILDQAAMMKGDDPRVWIWLSATTDDLDERYQYLQKAVSIDPSNSVAKRGLLILQKKLEATRKTPGSEPAGLEAAASPEGESRKIYPCPNCGANIFYDIHDITLVCQFCGFTHKVDELMTEKIPGEAVDAALLAKPTHEWSENQIRIRCELCGSVSMISPDQTIDRCPYCSSSRVASLTSLMELIDPQVIIPFKIDSQKASANLFTWLGRGALAPDKQTAQNTKILLQPAFFPFWIFSGTLEIAWFCDVNVGSGNVAKWEARAGTQSEMVSRLLITGLRKMRLQELTELEPFDFSEMVDFSQNFLTGGVVLAYDHPMADASQWARQIVIKKTLNSLSKTVEPGFPRRNLSLGPGRWIDLTGKLVLLPIYVGDYKLQGKHYRLLVNGQTGKVSGKKPIDMIKLAMFSIGALTLLAIVVFILWLLSKNLSGG